MTSIAVVGFNLTWDATLQNVVLGSLILGMTSGVLGCFAVLRGQSLIGDTLAHAALPGICVAFMLTGTRSSGWLLLGGLVTGLLGTLAMLAITRWSLTTQDTALGIILSVFFGTGVLLLTHIQHSEDAGQSGLDRFIFGQAATILPRDLIVMAIASAVALGTVALLFKEFKLLAFDPDFAASLGFRPGLTGTLLASLVVAAVMIGLQTVGVILMVSLLIAPAVAARQWTRTLTTMIVVSACFGMLSGLLGAVSSSLIDRLPTGPMIVLYASLLVIVSLLLAPRRGLLWNLRARRARSRAFARRLKATVHHDVPA